ncbi:MULTISPECIES: DUF2254 domain-containing protein [Francisella]|uniref:DUF2254 domain-containing protein n=1 Tax=Francisella opportunistica TaxID=2016517 RepID=A0A345JSG7_9GAMM|nr:MULTISPECIES: DUF2254 family protein [Francisella]APC92030.1 hypothetical protein BBG19_1298 [Francisella sp. MA067296]AXH30263.1 DUF2254 domain-containing protein [Francisella opportunistica]AXH31904.1 DUF2254 domain-containing protein [Francisella opportunistica]AXH33550.1 DUF2254 domain-containing protein [Francisella opportunistica]
MAKLFFLLKHQLSIIRGKLWFRPITYSILAIISVYSCYLLQRYEISFYPHEIKLETVNDLLSIITTSMLTIIVFAVGSIVDAYNSASNAGTPRILSLLLRDSSSQNAHSKFIGAFIYGVVATIGIKSEIFNQSGIFFIFITTILVFIIVISTFIIWIDDIVKLGQVRTSLSKSEKYAFENIKKYAKDPYMGCNKFTDNKMLKSVPIYAGKYSFLTDIALENLNTLCEKINAKVYIIRRNGEHLISSDVVAYVSSSKPLSQENFNEVVKNFIFSQERDYSGDPLFGLTILSEISAKAFFNNDPGTVIKVIDSLTGILDCLFETQPSQNVIYKNLYVKEIAIGQFIKSGFEHIRSYGSSNILVAKRLQKSLAHVAKQLKNDDEKFVLEYSKNCFEQASAQLSQHFEKNELEKFVKDLQYNRN